MLHRLDEGRELGHSRSDEGGIHGKPQAVDKKHEDFEN